MLPVKEVMMEKIALEIECVDRVYLNGYVKHLQLPGGLITFIRELMGFPIPSPMVLPPFTQAFRKAVEKYAQEPGLSIVDFAKGEDKDEKAKAYLAKFEKKQGVVLIGKAQEKALGAKGQCKDHGTKVWFDYSRQSLNVTYYYFYILDEEFGLFFIKVCTYIPFDIKVCLAARPRLRRPSGCCPGLDPSGKSPRPTLMRSPGCRGLETRPPYG